MDNRNLDLDLWEETGEKTANPEAKVGLEPFSKIRKINSFYSRGNRPLKKIDKENKTTWNNTAKSHDLPADTSQTQTQASKNEKRFRGRCGHFATSVNATKILKKHKDKDKIKKNLSYSKCHTFKKKRYYANKYLKKPKNNLAVAVTSMSMIEIMGELKSEFEQVFYILYSVTFKNQTETLLSSGNNVIAMSLGFISPLDLTLRTYNEDLILLSIAFYQPGKSSWWRSKNLHLRFMIPNITPSYYT